MENDWASILADAGIDVPISNSEFNIACPFHADNSPSLSINIDKGVWICHVGCGQGSLKLFLKEYLKFSWDEVTQYLQKRYATFDIDIFEVPSLEDSPEEVQPLEFPFKPGFVPPWIFDRGFSKKTLPKWDCTMDDEGSLIIPVKNKDDRLLGWISRRLYLTPKYLYSKGFKKSRTLFGINFLRKTDFLCITEGSLDAMWLDQHNYSSVALLGANLSKIQEELLIDAPIKELVLCLDNDTAGMQAAETMLTRLSSRCIVSVVQVPKGYKDVQDIKDSAILTDIIEQRELW